MYLGIKAITGGFSKAKAASNCLLLKRFGLLVGFGFSQNGVVIAESNNHTIFT